MKQTQSKDLTEYTNAHSKVGITTYLKSILFCLCFASISPKIESKIKVSDERARDYYIREAFVWERPPWITREFQFTSDLDILSGPSLPKRLSELNKDDVYCILDEEHLERKMAGFTPKFFCQILNTDDKSSYTRVYKKSGKKQIIKVKYGLNNPEVYSEIIGTRLLWALGFYADSVYRVQNLYCLGCSENPFKQKSIDKTSIVKPRIFTNVAVEKKVKGEEIVYIGSNENISMRGWSIKELVKKKTKLDPTKYKSQLINRDALRLLAAVIGHNDSKNENHKLICISKKNNDNFCDGKTKMLIHDIGTSFGDTSLSNLVRNGKVSKLDLEAWRRRNVWKDAKKCIPQVGVVLKNSSYYNQPISQEGRVFLVSLLEGFSKGKEGKTRIFNLFNVANIELYNGSVEEWSTIFLDKVRDISYPLGHSNTEFKCPHTIK